MTTSRRAAARAQWFLRSLMAASPVALLAFSAACDPAISKQDSPGSLAHAAGADSGATATMMCAPFVKLLNDQTEDRTIKSRLEDCRRRAGVLAAMRTTVRLLTDVHYTINEYHDEQPLPIAGSKYGPIAHIYAVPQLGSYTSIYQIDEQFPLGTLAAIVYIEGGNTAPLPPEYTKLQLVPGINCLWLAHIPAATPNNGWRAYATPVSTQNTCDRGAPPAAALPVTRTQIPSFKIGDYPNAARFIETTTSVGMGLSCLDGWCEIAVSGASTPFPDANGGSAREDKIKAWHDEQMLTEIIGGAITAVLPARIVPKPNLENIKVDRFAPPSWVSVATIILANDPPQTSKYYKWGLRAGKNTLQLQGVATSPYWSAQLIDPSNNPHPWAIAIRDPHTNEGVPSTARFRYTMGDPGLWIPCGQACCEAQGMLDAGS